MFDFLAYFMCNLFVMFDFVAFAVSLIHMMCNLFVMLDFVAFAVSLIDKMCSLFVMLDFVAFAVSLIHKMCSWFVMLDFVAFAVSLIHTVSREIFFGCKISLFSLAVEGNENLNQQNFDSTKILRHSFITATARRSCRLAGSLWQGNSSHTEEIQISLYT